MMLIAVDHVVIEQFFVAATSTCSERSIDSCETKLFVTKCLFLR